MADTVRSAFGWLRQHVTRLRSRDGGDSATEPTRREALKGGLAVMAGAAVTASSYAESIAEAEAQAGPATGARFGMAIDLDSCTACNACGVACRQENNVPTLGPEEENEAARIEWLSMLWQESDDPHGLPSALPFPCQHCQDAPCVKVCPTGATHKNSEGITVQIWDRCIGCRYCMVACPYSRISFNWKEPAFEGSLVQMLNPDVATRTVGMVEKCTFCSHRIRRSREEHRLAGTQPTDDDYRRMPACAQVCPADAITFGDLNDPDSAVSRLKRSPRAFRLLEHLGTDPNVIYLGRDRSHDPWTK